MASGNVAAVPAAPPPAARAVSASLRALYDPRSVALVGASQTPGKWGYELATRLLRGRHRRSVHLVSRTRSVVAGQPTVGSLAETPDQIDLVVSAVRPEQLEAVVDEGLALGVKAFIAVTGGLGELGGAAREKERELVERLRRHGARLLGPNCLGVIDTHTGLMASAWFDAAAERSGSVAVVTQSGTVGLDFELLARRAGIGFSRFVSVGNQADIGVAELLEDLADHEPTQLVVVYCEEFAEGRRAFHAARRLVESGRPVLLLAPGTSAAAARAAQSHTGSLTSKRAVIEAACAAAGVQLLGTTSHAVDVAQALLRTVRPRGSRVGVIADGGGYGVLVSDVLDAAGLSVPLLSDATQRRLAESLGPAASTANPVDLAAAAADPAALDRAVDIVVRSGDVDAIVVTGFVGDPPSVDELDVVREVDEVESGSGATQIIVAPSTAVYASSAGIPVLVQALFDESPSVRALDDLPVAVYRTSDSVGRALAGAVQAGTPAAGLPVERDAEAEPVVAEGYFAARQLLGTAGLSFARSLPAGPDPASVLDAARELSYPLALKAVDRLHKSDDGGVLLGIADEAALLRGHEDLVRRLGSQQFAVEEMVDAADSSELIIGAMRDAQFGSVVLVGFGGVLAEILHDVQLRLGPVTQAVALDTLRRLRGIDILTGARGRPAASLDAIASAMAALSRVAAAHPEIAEIEINPLLVSAHGAVGLDARMRLA